MAQVLDVLAGAGKERLHKKGEQLASAPLFQDRLPAPVIFAMGRNLLGCYYLITL